MTRAPILVIQLNHSQWHVLIPGRFATGVANYVWAVADALDWGVLDDRRVEIVTLDGDRTVLAESGSAWAR
jgi:hypothetical protein